jgi:hypothetical protein
MTSVKTSLEIEDNMIISVSESATLIIMCFQFLRGLVFPFLVHLNNTKSIPELRQVLV